MHDDINLVAPSGELDLSGARRLGPELAAATGDATRPLVVDLSAVTLMDSSALGAIVQAHLRMRRQGRPMAVVAPEGSPAADLLEMTKMRNELPVQPNRHAAESAVTRDGGRPDAAA